MGYMPALTLTCESAAVAARSETGRSPGSPQPKAAKTSGRPLMRLQPASAHRPSPKSSRSLHRRLDLQAARLVIHIATWCRTRHTHGNFFLGGSILGVSDRPLMACNPGQKLSMQCIQDHVSCSSPPVWLTGWEAWEPF